MHVHHKVAPIFHIYKSKGAVAPGVNVPYLRRVRGRRSQAWLSSRLVSFVGDETCSKLLAGTNGRYAQGVAVLVGVFVDFENLPEGLFVERVDDAGAVGGVFDLQTGSPVCVGDIVDAILGYLIPGIGIEGGGGCEGSLKEVHGEDGVYDSMVEIGERV